MSRSFPLRKIIVFLCFLGFAANVFADKIEDKVSFVLCQCEKSADFTSCLTQTTNIPSHMLKTTMLTQIAREATKSL